MGNQDKRIDPAFGKAGSTKRLAKAKREKDEQKFKNLINNMLPSLRSYIARRLNMAHSTGVIRKHRLIPEEVIDQVYIRLYDEYRDQAPKNLETWVYRTADEVLEEQLKEEAFEKEFLVELQKIEDIELSGLEETFTTDAEGELIMDEDLDDVSYTRKLYDPVEFIQDNETLEIIESSFSEFDKRRMHDEIQRLLLVFPEDERTVFDLFWIVGLSMNQIASIRGIPVTRIEEILRKVGLHLRKRLANR
jgi:RNA polymerase sigma factor (sigma-70 family)